MSGKSKDRYRLIEKENVRLQIEHIHTYPLLKKAVEEKRVEVHGAYDDLGDGSLTEFNRSGKDGIYLFFYPVVCYTPYLGNFPVGKDYWKGGACLGLDDFS